MRYHHITTDSRPVRRQSRTGSEQPPPRQSTVNTASVGSEGIVSKTGWAAIRVQVPKINSSIISPILSIPSSQTGHQNIHSKIATARVLPLSLASFTTPTYFSTLLFLMQPRRISTSLVASVPRRSQSLLSFVFLYLACSFDLFVRFWLRSRLHHSASAFRQISRAGLMEPIPFIEFWTPITMGQCDSTIGRICVGSNE